MELQYRGEPERRHRRLAGEHMERGGARIQHQLPQAAGTGPV